MYQYSGATLKIYFKKTCQVVKLFFTPNKNSSDINGDKEFKIQSGNNKKGCKNEKNTFNDTSFCNYYKNNCSRNI